MFVGADQLSCLNVLLQVTARHEKYRVRALLSVSIPRRYDYGGDLTSSSRAAFRACRNSPPYMIRLPFNDLAFSCHSDVERVQLEDYVAHFWPNQSRLPVF
jgi:hypothetical protein